MKKIVQFALLIIFMMMLNLIGYLAGISFIEGYSKYEWGHFHFFGSLFFISIYSVFQIFIFPINKKYREFIIPLFTLLIFSYLLYNDTDGFGGEIVHTIVSLTSRIIHVLYSFFSNNLINDTLRINFINLLYSLGFSLYLLIVFLPFKYLLRYLTSLCKEKGFTAVLNEKQITP